MGAEGQISGRTCLSLTTVGSPLSPNGYGRSPVGGKRENIEGSFTLERASGDLVAFLPGTSGVCSPRWWGDDGPDL